MLIDSHCHLDFPDLAPERDVVVARARAANVARMVTISTKVSEFAMICALAEAYSEVYCTVGTHPESAAEETWVSTGHLCDLANHPKCVGIGEAGLDYHYDKVPRDIAKAVFRTHIAAARQSTLPLIIHTRDADGDTAAILSDEAGKGPFTGLLHCFTATRMLAEIALSLGLYISFSGVLTFKKAESLREIARIVPMERLLVETDAPFLAPVPHRGKRNEPAFVAETNKCLAELKGVTVEAMAEATSFNALRLFTKMPPLANARGEAA
jgi:TatD DNase family protein